MKKFLLIALTCVTLAGLTGCLDSEEDLTITNNGSGVFKNTIDMSGLFDMMQMAAMMDTSAGSQLKEFSDKNIDSTFSLRAFTDTASTLTAEEKALLQDGTMRMTINQKEKVFKITMNYPFKKMEDVQKIMELQQSGKGFNPMGKAKDNPALGGMQDQGLPTADQITHLTFRNGLIERKVDQQKLNDLKSNDQFEQMQKAQDMLTGVTFTTTIHLPKAVTSSSGSRLSVSDDKKTVRVKYSLLDMIKNPQALEFKVLY